MINSFLFLLASVVLLSCGQTDAGNDYHSDTASIASGQHLFGKHCTACHNFYIDDIAPQLSNVTVQQTPTWIKAFIQHPDAVIRSGDSTATSLFNEYKVAMPSFSFLSESEIDDIMAYVHSQRRPNVPLETEDTNNLKNPIPGRIPTSNVLVEIDSFTQIPRSSEQRPLTRIIKLDCDPDTGEMYVADLRGKMYKLLKNGPALYLDIQSKYPNFIQEPGMATGFGSFVFHPEFTDNGLLYTTHAEAAGSAKADFTYKDIPVITLQWVLTEWKTDPKAFPLQGTGREVLRVDMPTGIHGIQQIAFNNTAKKNDQDYGLLYIGIGDGGSASVGKPLVSPSPSKIWGSIIRIDPTGHNSANGKYGIPGSNPFAKSSTENAVPEIYAYGFRNPHRFSWTKSGKLIAGNIGEHSIESLYLIESGRFYGWPIREGTFLERFFNNSGKVYPLPLDDSTRHVTYPIAQFDHDEGTAICAGFDYEGSIPSLKGKFVFGDIGTGTLFYINNKDIKEGKQANIYKWNITRHGKRTSMAELCGNSRVDMRFSQDANGELYIMTKADGKIYKLINRTN